MIDRSRAEEYCPGIGRPFGLTKWECVANAETAKKILAEAISRIPTEPNWPEHRALDTALVTDQKLWPATPRQKLGAILGRFT